MRSDLEWSKLKSNILMKNNLTKYQRVLIKKIKQSGRRTMIVPKGLGKGNINLKS
jgi:hypothetical protein